MVDGRRVEEALGWESQWKQSRPDGTISLEQEAVRRRAELLKHQEEGTGPSTLREQRAENKAKREAAQAELKPRHRHKRPSPNTGANRISLRRSAPRSPLPG